MGRVPGKLLLTSKKKEARILIMSLVLLENRPCPCPFVPGLLSNHRLLHLGSKIRQISHVSSTPEAESARSRPDSHNHLHIRRQLHLRPPFLAHTSVQRVWTRPGRCWGSRATGGIQYYDWGCGCSFHAQCLQRSYSGVDDCQLYHHDSG